MIGFFVCRDSAIKFQVLKCNDRQPHTFTLDSPFEVLFMVAGLWQHLKGLLENTLGNRNHGGTISRYYILILYTLFCQVTFVNSFKVC